MPLVFFFYRQLVSRVCDRRPCLIKLTVLSWGTLTITEKINLLKTKYNFKAKQEIVKQTFTFLI